MSNNHDLFCIDCDEYGGWHWNHGGADLAEIWSQRAHIAALAPALDAVQIEIKIGWAESGGHHDSVRFIAKHLTHNVQVINEYGAIREDCDERFSCDDCRASGTCRRKKGHDGKHGRERDYTPVPAAGDATAGDRA